MGLVQYGGGVAQISGSVGGNTFARNKAGFYVRNRTVPINPGSARQQTVRFGMAQLATRWVETLTDAQRAGWETYSANVHLPNSLGQLRDVGGIGMFVRSNVPRITSIAPLLTLVDDAPTIFDLGTFSEPVAESIDAIGDTVSWAFTDTDAWAIEDGAAMYVFGSRPQNPSVNFFKGPYQIIASIPGALVPPTSPQVIALAFPVAVGNKVFFRCNVSRADGRLASSFRTFQVGA
jgi:hypothetical protein